MANLTGMPISSLPETTLQEGDQVVGYRAETGKAYRTDLADEITSLREEVSELKDSLSELNVDNVMTYRGRLTSSDNLDDIFQTGIYYCQTASMAQNSPCSNAGIILVFYAPGGTIQWFSRYAVSNEHYIRVYYGGDKVWLGWRSINNNSLS